MRQHVLVLAPLEGGQSAKTGGFDESTPLDDTRLEALGPMLEEHCKTRRAQAGITEDEDDSSSFFGNVPDDEMGPSQLSLAREKVDRQRSALVDILREYVGELWEARDFKRLKTIELVFLLRWKHRRIADPLDYQDEKAIAGVKFRAIRDFQDRLRRHDPNRSLFSKLWD